MDELLAHLERDPARTRRYAALGLVVVAGATGIVASGRDDAESDPCAAVVEAVDHAWNDERRAQAEAAFLREPEPFAAQTWERVSSSFDGFASEWRQARRMSCEALVVSGGTSQDVALQARCLDHSLRRFEAVADLLVDAERQTIVRAVDLVSSLGTPTRCLEPAGFRTVPPVPEDGSLRPEVESIRRVIATGIAHVEAGRVEDARALLESAFERAQATGYEPVTTEAATHLAGLYVRSGDVDRGQPLLRDALGRAFRGGRDDLAAALLDDAAVINARYRGELELALFQLEEAGALVEQLESGPAERARLELSLAAVLRQRNLPGDVDRALRMDAEALAVIEREGDVSERLFALALVGRGMLQAKDYDGAAPLLERSRALAIRHYGPAHPQVAAGSASLARVYMQSGDHARAVELLEPAYETVSSVLTEDHVNTIAIANSLAIALEYTGRHEDALAYARQAYDSAVGAMGQSNRDVGIARDNLANALRRAGQTERAAALLRVSVAEETQRSGDGGESTLEARTLLADTLRVAEDYSAATAEYEALLSALESADGERTETRSRALAGLALCRIASGNEDGAVTAARRSVAALGDMASTPSQWRVSQSTLAYVLRAAGHHDEAAAVAESLAATFAGSSDASHLAQAFTRWQAGEDVMPLF